MCYTYLIQTYIKLRLVACNSLGCVSRINVVLSRRMFNQIWCSDSVNDYCYISVCLEQTLKAAGCEWLCSDPS